MTVTQKGFAPKAGKTEDEWRFRFRFLVREEEGLFVAYCLELDLVTAAKSEEEAVEDLIDVTIEQVRYCIANDNMDHLFRRAPEEIWKEYYSCEKLEASRPHSAIEAQLADLPISFIAHTCRSHSFCHG
jgi:hypothetical protein